MALLLQGMQLHGRCWLGALALLLVLLCAWLGALALVPAALSSEQHGLAQPYCKGLLLQGEETLCVAAEG